MRGNTEISNSFCVDRKRNIFPSMWSNQAHLQNLGCQELGDAYHVLEVRITQHVVPRGQPAPQVTFPSSLLNSLSKKQRESEREKHSMPILMFKDEKLYFGKYMHSSHSRQPLSNNTNLTGSIHIKKFSTIYLQLLLQKLQLFRLKIYKGTKPYNKNN